MTKTRSSFEIETVEYRGHFICELVSHNGYDIYDHTGTLVRSKISLEEAKNLVDNKIQHGLNEASRKHQQSLDLIKKIENMPTPLWADEKKYSRYFWGLSIVMAFVSSLLIGQLSENKFIVSTCLFVILCILGVNLYMLVVSKSRALKRASIQQTSVKE